MTVDPLLSRLQGVSGKAPRWRAICPSCGGRNRSKLSIYEADDGRVLLKCFAGCDVYAIVRAVGMELDDLFPPPHDRNGRSRYTDGERGRVRKPWANREVAQAFERELMVAWVLLRDLANQRPIGASDRQRAALCAERCEALMAELGHG